jgi:hypothetical protein
MRQSVTSYPAVNSTTHVFYFSGHGLRTDEGQLYLGASNTRNDAIEYTAIDVDFIARALQRTRCQRTVIILDCCYSAAFDRSLNFKKGARDAQDAIQNALEGEGRVLISSSTASQVSLDGEAGEEPGLSLFTSHLVDGLETGAADVDKDGFVTSTDLFRHLSERFGSEAAEQSPTLSAHGLRGDIIVAYSHWSSERREIELLPIELSLALRSPMPHERQHALKRLPSQIHPWPPEPDTYLPSFLQNLHRTDDSLAVRRVAAELLRQCGFTSLALADDFAPLRDTTSRAAEDWSDTLDSFLEWTQKAFKYLDAAAQREGDVPFDYGNLDNILGGLRKGDLVVVTNFGDDLTYPSGWVQYQAVHTAVKLQLPTLLVSLDLSREDVILEWLSHETGIDGRKVVAGRLDDKDWQQIAKSFSANTPAPLSVYESERNVVDDVRSACTSIDKLSLVVVRGVEVCSSHESEHARIGDYLRGLRQLASDLEVPVLVGMSLTKAEFSNNYISLNRWPTVLIDLYSEGDGDDAKFEFYVRKNDRGPHFIVSDDEEFRWPLRQRYRGQDLFELSWSLYEPEPITEPMVWEQGQENARNSVAFLLDGLAAALRDSGLDFPRADLQEINSMIRLFKNSVPSSSTDDLDERGYWHQWFVRAFESYANGSGHIR